MFSPGKAKCAALPISFVIFLLCVFGYVATKSQLDWVAVLNQRNWVAAWRQRNREQKNWVDIWKQEHNEWQAKSLSEQQRMLSNRWNREAFQRGDPWKLRMTLAEGNLFKKLLLDSPRQRYLEFGSGGSTTWAALVFDQVYSVENGKEWCDRLKNHFDNNNLSSVVHMECVDTGAIRRFSKPKSKKHNKRGADYAGAVDKVASEFNIESFDVVLIDGRWRVSSAAKSFSRMRPDSILIIHDYGNRRRHYDKVLELFERIALINTMGVFQKRTDAKNDDAEKVASEASKEFMRR